MDYEQLGNIASLTMGQSPTPGSCDDDERGMPFLQGCAEFGNQHPESKSFCHAPLKVAKASSTLISVRAPVGTTNRADRDYCIGRGLAALLARGPSENNDFLQYAVEQNVSFLHRRSQGSTFLAISSGDLYQMKVPHPQKVIQDKIADILLEVDGAIHQTQALIEKQKQIKTGVMHDLFTRGLDENDQLRPPRSESQEVYKKSSLGWIPRDWNPLPIGSIVDSLIDGPFGSNLKTEHYVEDGGVRVVRLQNVQAGFYNDSDKAFVSERHARFLSKNSVVSGDVLIAALGDENYPVGRACLYPTNLPPAINKADCFRLRSFPSKALNSFIMNYLNTPAAKSQIDRYKQGVTRQRVNTTNLKKVIVPLPPPDEQKRIATRIAVAEASLQTLTDSREKLLKLKRGLMNDLLNGTLPVISGERVEEQAHV